MTQEDSIFQAAMKGVRRLGASKPRPKKKPAPSTTPSILPAAPLSAEELASDAQEQEESFADLFEGKGDHKEPTNKTQSPKTASAEQTAKSGGASPAKRAIPRAPLHALTIGDLTQLDSRTAERLKRGKLPIDHTLDLHGLNKEAAHDQFAATIEHAVHSGARLVLVITGKGYRSEGGRAILREALKDWLNQENIRPLILACCPAQLRDGGKGAFYCLLKRKRNR